jgi:hypothetical protein
MVTKAATGAGIIAVSAAGNGNEDLDSSQYSEYMSRGDSGAIIVGAEIATKMHSKPPFSTCGSRVDVQAWGDCWLRCMRLPRIGPSAAALHQWVQRH